MKEKLFQINNIDNESITNTLNDTLNKYKL